MARPSTCGDGLACYDRKTADGRIGTTIDKSVQGVSFNTFHSQKHCETVHQALKSDVYMPSAVNARSIGCIAFAAVLYVDDSSEAHSNACLMFSSIDE